MAHPAPSTRACAYNARGRAKHTGRERGSTEDIRGIIGGNRGCRGKRGTKGGEEETRGKGDKNLKAIFESDTRSVFFVSTRPAIRRFFLKFRPCRFALINNKRKKHGIVAEGSFTI